MEPYLIAFPKLDSKNGHVQYNNGALLAPGSKTGKVSLVDLSILFPGLSLCSLMHAARPSTTPHPHASIPPPC